MPILDHNELHKASQHFRTQDFTSDKELAKDSEAISERAIKTWRAALALVLETTVNLLLIGALFVVWLFGAVAILNWDTCTDAGCIRRSITGATSASTATPLELVLAIIATCLSLLLLERSLVLRRMRDYWTKVRGESWRLKERRDEPIESIAAAIELDGNFLSFGRLSHYYSAYLPPNSDRADLVVRSIDNMFTVVVDHKLIVQMDAIEDTEANRQRYRAWFGPNRGAPVLVQLRGGSQLIVHGAHFEGPDARTPTQFCRTFSFPR